MHYFQQECMTSVFPKHEDLEANTDFKIPSMFAERSFYGRPVESKSAEFAAGTSSNTFTHEKALS